MDKDIEQRCSHVPIEVDHGRRHWAEVFSFMKVRGRGVDCFTVEKVRRKWTDRDFRVW